MTIKPTLDANNVKIQSPVMMDNERHTKRHLPKAQARVCEVCRVEMKICLLSDVNSGELYREIWMNERECE